ncbi:MAG: hypothetical protein EP343_01215 [Deltaproteobacteria bacterium]|nr:MAG: hypothetical protein EP343_01215 [Deltaproteobacteria bacterium]
MPRGVALNPSSQLAELLVRTGTLSQAQVEQLLQEQQRWGGRLSQLVVEQGILHEEQLVQLLNQEMRYPVMTLDRLRHIPPEVIKLVPVGLCEALDVIPVTLEMPSRRLFVAMSEPTNGQSLRQLQETTGLHIEACVAATSAIRWAIRMYFYGGAIDGLDSGPQRPPSSYAGAPPSQPMRPVSSYGTSAEIPQPHIPPGQAPYQQRYPSSTPGQQWGTGNYTQAVTGAHPQVPPHVTGNHPHLRPGMTGSHPHIPGQPPAHYTGSHPHVQGGSPMPASVANVTGHSIAVATSKGEAEARTNKLHRELQQLRQEFSAYKAESEKEVKALQELVANRFYEHRLMMRGLFDLLVERGYLSKEELVSMLSSLNDSSGLT